MDNTAKASLGHSGFCEAWSSSYDKTGKRIIWTASGRTMTAEELKIKGEERAIQLAKDIEWASGEGASERWANYQRNAERKMLERIEREKNSKK